jgi:hypothetical protein
MWITNRSKLAINGMHIFEVGLRQKTFGIRFTYSGMI